MDLSSCNGSKRRRVALSAAALTVLAFSAGSALAINQSGEQKDMKLVGHVDLQFRGSYQPNVIQYPDGRTIAFAGLHSGQNLPGPLPNPLNGGKLEENGTMIIDITDPKHPVETFHIPVPVAGAQAQALVGMQYRYRVHAGQQRHHGGLASLAPKPVHGHRGLGKSSCRPNLPPHSRFAGWTTERNRTDAHLAAWSDLRASASQCCRQAGERRRRYRQPYLRGMGRWFQRRVADFGPE